MKRPAPVPESIVQSVQPRRRRVAEVSPGISVPGKTAPGGHLHAPAPINRRRDSTTAIAIAELRAMGFSLVFDAPLIDVGRKVAQVMCKPAPKTDAQVSAMISAYLLDVQLRKAKTAQFDFKPLNRESWRKHIAPSRLHDHVPSIVGTNRVFRGGKSESI